MTRRLVLKSEPTSYGADARPPAPVWLIEGTPGAPELAEKLAQATQAAREAQEARNAAIRAFRAASRTDLNNEWSPLPTIEYDRWRILRNAMDDAELAERNSHRPVKAAWIALRAHLAQSDEAAELADATAATRYQAAQAAASGLRDRIRDYTEASSMLADSDFGRPNVFSYIVEEKSALERLSRDADALFNPQKPWRFARRPA